MINFSGDDHTLGDTQYVWTDQSTDNSNFLYMPSTIVGGIKTKAWFNVALLFNTRAPQVAANTSLFQLKAFA